jgi:hypothetical protein
MPIRSIGIGSELAIWLIAIHLANIEIPRSGIAQLEEQRPVKAMVGGSSPPAGAENLSKVHF